MADPVVVLFIDTILGYHSRTVTLTGMSGIKMFPTIHGSGDASLNCYFGPLLDPFTLDPAAGLPNGFFPGVANNAGTGFSQIAGGATYLAGSAVHNGNLVSFPTTPGMAQVPDGWTQGSWMFCTVVSGLDVFSTHFGCGWACEYGGGGAGKLDPNFWLSNGQKNSTDVNGGALIYTGGFNTFHPTFAAQGNVIEIANSYSMGINSTIGAAILLDPPVTLATYDPQKLIQQNLPCVPCCPVCPSGGRF